MWWINTPLYQHWLRIWQAALLGDRGYAAGYREGLTDASKKSS